MKILWIQNGSALGAPLPAILEGLADNIELIYSSNPKDAPELCAAHTPDLIVISAGSSDEEGLRYAAHIKRDFQSVKVCFVIDTKIDALVKAAKTAGADIVAPESISYEELNQLYQYSKMHYRVFPASDS